ncbi:TIM barrel protein [Methanococcoides sp. SA1]|nr:TIM barrel protein [Methanococcoides sp. SA1]
MKFGIKNYDDEEFFDFFEGKADFFEVQAIRGNDYSYMKKYDLPIVVHAEHRGFGSNYFDSKKYKENLESLNFAKKLADELGAEKIIVHFGNIEDKDCSVENGINFLNENWDDRILIENLVINEGYRGYPSSTEEVGDILSRLKCGFIFDVNHAIDSAIYFEKDPYEYVKKFLGFNISHYHLCGQNIEKRQTHLGLVDSDIDLDKIVSMLPKDAEVTLELTLDKEEVEKDLEFVREIEKNSD